MTMLTPHDILSKARQKIIDPALWHQGSSYKGEAACAVAWTHRVAGSAPGPYGGGAFFNESARLRALDYLRREMLGCDSSDPDRVIMLGDIPAWNDDPERTHAEVVAAFDRAVLAAARDEGLFAPYDDRTTEDARELVLV
jgi:hypothetical protein